MGQMFDHQEDLHQALDEALDRDDWETVAKLRAQIDWEPHVLDQIKQIHGIEYVRRMNYNTKHAVEAYGENWLAG